MEKEERDWGGGGRPFSRHKTELQQYRPRYVGAAAMSVVEKGAPLPGRKATEQTGIALRAKAGIWKYERRTRRISSRPRDWRTAPPDQLAEHPPFCVTDRNNDKAKAKTSVAACVCDRLRSDLFVELWLWLNLCQSMQFNFHT